MLTIRERLAKTEPLPAKFDPADRAWGDAAPLGDLSDGKAQSTPNCAEIWECVRVEHWMARAPFEQAGKLEPKRCARRRFE